MTSRAQKAAKVNYVILKLENVAVDVKLLRCNPYQANYKIVVFQSVLTEPRQVPIVIKIVKELVLIKNVGKILVLA